MELSVVLTLHVISERTVYISLLLYLLPETVSYHPYMSKAVSKFLVWRQGFSLKCELRVLKLGPYRNQR
jgi:hypothetical protein